VQKRQQKRQQKNPRRSRDYFLPEKPPLEFIDFDNRGRM
jgi:hypothetical protein